jgi:processive 1,2-diacylglycerol beta-glucosyltransferase
MNKHQFLVVLGCIITICLLLKTAVTQNNIPSQRKKIVILTSKGGYGHSAACKVLQETLTDFDLTIINPFETTLLKYDVIKKITRDSLDGEGFYNKLLQKGYVRTTNFIAGHTGPFFFHLNHRGFEKRFTELLKKEKPDLFLSLIPLVNEPASAAAAQANIPFLLITLDADLTLWLKDMKKCKHPHYAVTIGTNTPRITKQLASNHIPQKNVHIVGHPIRQDFYTPKDVTCIRSEWNIPNEKPVVLVMRGGSGSDKLIDYTKTLLGFNEPLHILVCIGRNTTLESKLKQLQPTKYVTFSIIPFTTKIADLMAISELLICPPSPNTCNEARALGLPICIDCTEPCLFWEHATIDWINIDGTETQLKKMKKLPAIVKEYINKRTTQRHIPIWPDFATSIKEVIHGLLQESVIKSADGNIIQPPETGKGNPQIS